MRWLKNLFKEEQFPQETPQLEVILLEEGADVGEADHFIIRGRVYKIRINGDVSEISSKAMEENKKAAYDALDLSVILTKKYIKKCSFDIRHY